MITTLDGKNLFDNQQLEIELESVSRDSIERTIAGVDGVLSVDLGGRSRVIRQKGVLRAATRVQMDAKIGSITANIDGSTHMLVTGSGEIFDNLRMDSFKQNKERVTGSGLACNYEIIYRQLVA
ncbi:MAG: hypothetical protein ACYSSL_01600 [Planctomycetota bacterium]|jgi:hypothetical protein